MSTKVIIDKTGEAYVLHKYNSQGVNNENILICAQTAHKAAKELKKMLPSEVLEALLSDK